MKKQNIIIPLCASVCALMIGLPLSAQKKEALTLPRIPMPDAIHRDLAKESDVEKLLAGDKSAEAYYRAGCFYLYNVFNLLDDFDKKKSTKKKLLDKAIGYYEKSVELDPANPIYLGQLGNAYGYRITFSGFPALMIWSKKCKDSLDKAVKKDPENPEVRLVRFRSLVYYPYEYYDYLRDVIFDDANHVLKWLEDYQKEAVKNPKLKERYDAYFFDARHNTYWCLGYYYYTQLKNETKAKSFLEKVDRKSWYYKQSREILDKID